MTATTPRPAAHAAARVPPQPLPDEPTLGALVHDLSEQLPALIRSEIRLAQAEVAEKSRKIGAGVGMFGVAGYLGHLAVFALLTAAVLGLAEVVPGWASALIVAAALLTVAGIAALLGRRTVTDATPPVPERALAGVHEDVEILKGARP